MKWVKQMFFFRKPFLGSVGVCKPYNKNGVPLDWKYFQCGKWNNMLKWNVCTLYTKNARASYRVWSCNQTNKMQHDSMLCNLTLIHCMIDNINVIPDFVMFYVSSLRISFCHTGWKLKSATLKSHWMKWFEHIWVKLYAFSF